MILESFSRWLENPCNLLTQQLLVRGLNFFVGFCPDKTPRTTLPEDYDYLEPYQNTFVVLLQQVEPEQSYDIDTITEYRFQLRFIGDSYFRVKDLAESVYSSFYNEKGIIFPELSYTYDDDMNNPTETENDYEFFVGGIMANGPFFIGRDEKARYTFGINIRFMSQYRLTDVSPWPEGYIPIRTPDELILIGNDEDYPLSSNYWLTNDLDLTDYSNTIIGSYDNTAFFTGIFEGNNYEISNINIDTTGTGTGTSAVGLFAIIYDTGIVQNLNVSGSVIADNSASGLICGALSGGGTISKCSSSGSVTGVGLVGGICGAIFEGGNIYNSYSTATVTGTFSIGGICGVLSEINPTTIVSNIQNCYAIGLITGDSVVSGILGSNLLDPEWINATGCAFDSTTTGIVDSDDYGTAYTTAEMLTSTPYSGWDFTTIWNQVEDLSYPFFRV